MRTENHITILIYENDHVKILDEKGDDVPPVPPGDVRYKPLIGPQNCYEQILWYTGNSI